MKKINLLFFVAVISLQAQQNIDIAKGYNSIVMFNSDISEETENIRIGNEEEFIVSKISDRVIEIKVDSESNPSSGTNCTVITNDGKLYLFNLNLKSKISSKVIEADPQLATNINSNDGYVVSSTIENYKKNESITRDKDYEKVIENCENNAKRKKRVFTTPSKSNNVILTVRDIAHRNNKLYLFFDINNKGGQSYQVEWVNMNTTTKLGETRSIQTKILTPYYIHNEPKIVKGKSKYKFIVVLNKTTINQNKQISIDIKELGGERNLILNINDEIINNPIQL